LRTKRNNFLKCLVKKLNISIVYFSYVQTAFWDAIPPGLHIPNFLHRKDLRTSKPGKKNLTTAPRKKKKKPQQGWNKKDTKWRKRCQSPDNCFSSRCSP